MRRRAEKKTIPERYVSMREISQQWHAQLNSKPVNADANRNGGDQGANSTQEG